MTLALLLALLAWLGVVIARRGPGATVEPPTLIELAEARAKVMLKLRRYEKERARRMKLYDARWSKKLAAQGRPRPRYLLEFAERGRA